MSGLPDSHAKDGLKYDPIVTGSFVYALLTALGLACVFGAKGMGKLESKEVGMSLVFVATAGVCMWIVYISTWMVRVRALFLPWILPTRVCRLSHARVLKHSSCCAALCN